MYRNQRIGLLFLALLINSSILPILCHPNSESFVPIIYSPTYENGNPSVAPTEGEYRKFAVKQNPTKKATEVVTAGDQKNEVDNSNSVQSNPVPEYYPSTGFSWGTMLNAVIQMLFNSALAPASPPMPSKSDNGNDIDQHYTPPSPWANIFALGLKIVTALLSGGRVSGNDGGIDKVDNASPYQGILTAVLSAVLGTKNDNQVSKVAEQAGEFINIIMQLLETLKQSFGHRSLNARSLGKKDPFSDAGVAALTLAKGYVRTMRSSNVDCVKKIVCESNKECVDNFNQTSNIYCQLGTYATNNVIHKTKNVPFNILQEAGTIGRSTSNPEECSKLYPTCQES